MKSKSFFALLLAVSVFLGAMVFAQAENTLPEETPRPVQEDISVFVPDKELLNIFQVKEEELDALGNSRSHFSALEKTLLKYQNIASWRKEYQEKALLELHTLQKNIKNNQVISEDEIKKLQKDITTLETEKAQLDKKQKDTEELLKKLYQQEYMHDIKGDKNITFMSLLLPKTFGTSIKESEILSIMKLSSQSLIAQQESNQEKLTKIHQVIKYQESQKVRVITRLDRYTAELAETEILKAALLGKTIARQGAIQDTLKSNKNKTQTLTQKFEQKFAEYEIDIQKYSEKYSCKTQKTAICTWILGYIKAEKTLRMQEEKVEPAIWPISTENAFGFHFRDQKYHNIHNEHHTGLDILATKDTPVKAMNDGYIIAQRSATLSVPGVIIIKNRNGLLTVYRNIKPKKDVKLFTIIKKGEDIGIVGTVIDHSDKNNLHIEMYLRGVLTDPMEQMSLENIAVKNIPGRYGWKYIDDMKKAKKEVDIAAVQKTIGFFYIPGESELERQKNMLEKYAGTAFRDQKMWIEESITEGVDPSFTLCVGFAESTLGQNLTTSGNIGNVGNTDSGARRDYDGSRAGIRAIAAVVNNQWLGHYQTIDQLSGWGNPRGPIYASSPTNWHENIVKCVSALKGKYIGNYSPFRLNQADLLNYEKEGYKRIMEPEVVIETSIIK